MTAKKYSEGKPKLSKIDPDFMDEMARALEMGDDKYGQADWMKGMPFSELIDSAERHISKIKRSIFTDEESGCPHTAHVATSMMMLQFYVRWKPAYQGMNDLRFHRIPPEVGVPAITAWENPDNIIDEDYVQPAIDFPGPVPDFVDLVEGEALDPIIGLQNRIKTWADRVMPNRTPHQALSKLTMEEIPELLNGGIDDPSEWADVFILVLDAANLRGIDVVEAAHNKMAINESSDWRFDIDTGFAKRVK